jgi:uncharacterized RDD family membrane protein YckC
MGNYIPPRPSSKRTIAETLQESEYEHYLDCPNADIVIRFAALFLDFILCSIAWSAINHLSGAVSAALLSLPASWDVSSWANRAVGFGVWVVRLTMLYLYFVWAVAAFSGTAGKILLGLRMIDAQTGNRVLLPRVLLREIALKALSIASVLGILMPLVRADRRALHDVMSGTVVKQIRGAP